jgi:ATPase family associated with various cellular activities (AAA)
MSGELFPSPSAPTASGEHRTFDVRRVTISPRTIIAPAALRTRALPLRPPSSRAAMASAPLGRRRAGRGSRGIVAADEGVSQTVCGTFVMSASDLEAREFAAAFRSFLEWVHSGGDERDEVAGLVKDFLGAEGVSRSVVTRPLPVFEHVNLQTALDAWSAEPGRDVVVHGLMLPPHYGGVTLQQLVSGDGHQPLRLSAAPLVDLPNGPGSTLACLRLGLLLVGDERGRYVVMINGPTEHAPGLEVEIAGLEVEAAQAVQARLGELRSRLNVYRGQVLDVAIDPMGGVVLEFGEIPGTAREDVVLPELVLGRVERHALGVAAHRDALLAAGQHLKRGLLLYGPPGTGKTHTTRYLVGRMAGYTRLLLTGRALGAIGSVAELARDLQPAVVVLEDVDLVAEERSFGPGASPVLFDLLDAMDGAAPDADLLFVLTTNRADLLEPALAARPGRVDVAVEIDLPDADARERLLALYGRSLPLHLTDAETRDVVERTDGVTASFLKELLRRAMLESLQAGTANPEVSAAHVSQALDDLLDSTQQLTRSLLGVGNDPETLPPGGGLGSLPPQPGRGWLRAQNRARVSARQVL